MKATEVMVGDFIYDTACNEIVQYNLQDFAIDPIRLLGNCKPIPLTAEILEKNGWKHYPENKERGLMERCALDYVGNAYFFSNGYIEFEIIGIRAKGRLRKEFQYVHELQHALRLCGLNDLADNFVI